MVQCNINQYYSTMAKKFYNASKGKDKKIGNFLILTAQRII